MIERSFTVMGEPRGQGRPRFVRATGRAYKSSEDVSYERKIQTAYWAKYGNQPMMDGAFAVSITAHMSVPESVSAPKKAALLKTRPTKKPDVDNIIKAVLDALNGVAFTDDKCCVSLSAAKRYAETPCLEITLRGGVKSAADF